MLSACAEGAVETRTFVIALMKNRSKFIRMIAMALRTRGAAMVITLMLLLTGYSTALAVSTPTQDAVLELNPAKTLIAYTLKGWPHITNGTFKLEKGVVRVDPATGKATGSVIVGASSVDSGSHMRDGEADAEISS